MCFICTKGRIHAVLQIAPVRKRTLRSTFICHYQLTKAVYEIYLSPKDTERRIYIYKDGQNKQLCANNSWSSVTRI